MSNESQVRSKTVKLQSGEDGRVVEISVEAAGLSEFINNARGDEDDEGESTTSTPVEIPRISEAVLDLVVQFLTHYAMDPMQEMSTPLEGVQSIDAVVRQDFYRDFIQNLDLDTLWDVVSAANYLSIRPLLQLACLRASFAMSGMNAEEIRQMLNLPRL